MIQRIHMEEISLETKLDTLDYKFPLKGEKVPYIVNPAEPRVTLSLESQVIRIQYLNNKLKPLACCGKVAIVFDLEKGCPFCSAEYREVI